jgi:DNA polymerase-3 subunit alpha
MVGVINNFGGFYRTEFYFHEARMCGANIEAPCVNNSQYFTSIAGDRIHIGFIHLKSLESRIGEKIPEERKLNGLYTDMTNFIRRIPIGLEQINILIRIGAFRFTGETKRTLLWKARMHFNQPKEVRHTSYIFDSPVKDFQLPTLESPPFEDAFDELELLGFPLCDPFLLLAEKNPDDITVDLLLSNTGKQVVMTGYLVTIKNTRTKNHLLMHFGTFIDRKGHFFDTTHFPGPAKKYPFRGKGFYSLKGKVAVDFGYPMLEVSSMKKLTLTHKFSPQTT